MTVNRMTDHNQDKTSKPPAPPTATYEVQRAYNSTYRDLTILQAIFQATKGVFRPGPNDPKTWYGRAFRFVGLLCVWLVIAIIILLVAQNFLRGIRSN